MEGHQTPRPTIQASRRQPPSWRRTDLPARNSSIRTIPCEDHSPQAPNLTRVHRKTPARSAGATTHTWDRDAIAPEGAVLQLFDRLESAVHRPLADPPPPIHTPCPRPPWPQISSLPSNPVHPPRTPAAHRLQSAGRVSRPCVQMHPPHRCILQPLEQPTSIRGIGSAPWEFVVRLRRVDIRAPRGRGSSTHREQYRPGPSRRGEHRRGHRRTARREKQPNPKDLDPRPSPTWGSRVPTRRSISPAVGGGVVPSCGASRKETTTSGFSRESTCEATARLCGRRSGLSPGEVDSSPRAGQSPHGGHDRSMSGGSSPRRAISGGGKQHRGRGRCIFNDACPAAG